MDLVNKEDDLEVLEYMHITSIKEQDQKSLDAMVCIEMSLMLFAFSVLLLVLLVYQ